RTSGPSRLREHGESSARTWTRPSQIRRGPGQAVPARSRRGPTEHQKASRLLRPTGTNPTQKRPRAKTGGQQDAFFLVRRWARERSGGTRRRGDNRVIKMYARRRGGNELIHIGPIRGLELPRARRNSRIP